MGGQKMPLRLTQGFAQLRPHETAEELMARAQEPNLSAGASYPVATA
jgi:hypothetical protein